MTSSASHWWRRARKATTAHPHNSLRYQFGNHLGSASLELDDAGQIISYEEYYPYGSTSYQAGRSAAEVSLKRYRYTGKERDEETGFNYHGARYYASWVGTWVSCDPVGLKGGIVLYRFASSNPVGLVDPTGTDDLPWWYRTDEQLAGIRNRIKQLEGLLALNGSYYSSNHTGQPENAMLAEGIRLDPKQASLIAHELGNLRSLLTINKRFGQKAADATAKAKWEAEHGWVDKLVTSYEKEKAYRAEKERHRDREVRPNILLDMTNTIVEKTPEASGKLWLLFAAGLGTGEGSLVPRPQIHKLPINLQ